MLTDFVSDFLARWALSRREQKQNKFLLFWAKAQRAKKALNISLPITSKLPKLVFQHFKIHKY